MSDSSNAPNQIQLPGSASDLNEVPEQFRELYVQRTSDGRFVPNIADAGGVGLRSTQQDGLSEDLTGLKNSVAAARDERDQFKAQAAQLRSELEALRVAEPKAPEPGSQDGESLTRAQVDQLIADAKAEALAAGTEAAKGELEPQLELSKQRADRVQDAATSAAVRRMVGEVARQLGLGPGLVGGIVGQRVLAEFDEGSGEIVETVLGADGKPWSFKEHGETRPATLKDLADQLRAEHPEIKPIAPQAVSPTAGAQGGAGNATAPISVNGNPFESGKAGNRRLALEMIREEPQQAKRLAAAAKNPNGALVRMAQNA